MFTEKQKQKEETTGIKTFAGAIISPDVKDFSNHPYFVKKTEEAEAFLLKHGLPEDLIAAYSNRK